MSHSTITSLFSACVIVIWLSGCSTFFSTRFPSIPESVQSRIQEFRVARSGQPSLAARPPSAEEQTIWRDFFKTDYYHLALRCNGVKPCPDIEKYQSLLGKALRGSYAGGGILENQSIDVEDAYSRHATDYLTDIDYPCKHPLIAKALESSWNLQLPLAKCTEKLPFLVSASLSGSEIRWIDPSRVYAVHLLFAGATGKTISSFGHVSLRLVICNAERVTADEKCNEDLFDHISLGFKAGIDELNISLLKGINGGYPIKLYAQPFIDAYREYTIDEFRDLYSLPLIISDQEKFMLLRTLSEAHWSYTNSYRFFTQNCATETQWILNATLSAYAVPDRNVTPEFRSRPDTFFADARLSNFFDNRVLRDLAEAEKRGNFFPSAERYYQMALNTLFEILPPPPENEKTSPALWLDTEAVYRREQWILPAIESSQPERRERTAHAAMVLETWVARHRMREFLADLLDHYHALYQTLADDKEMASLPENRPLLECVKGITATDSIGKKRDGIPHDIKPLAANGCDVSNQDLINAIKAKFEIYKNREHSKKIIAELETTAKNIKKIQSFLPQS